MNVGVVGNPRYGDLKTVLEQFGELARSRGITLVPESRLDAVLDRRAADGNGLQALFTFGGDGTLLRGARLLDGAPVPILGVNLGRVGFLTSATRDTLPEALDAICSGKHVIEERLALEVTITGRNGLQRVRHRALNDVALHKGGVARVIRMQVRIEGEAVGPYSADGIVIASPTGSTAYSLSAGGPIVVPGVEAMVVTPICAHTLAVRPLVVPADYTVTVEPVAPATDDVMVSFDGQVGNALAMGDRVDVRRSPQPVLLVRLGPRGFFTRMREKLHWGDLSEREAER
ncbi:MAG: NAD(+)/NADH kinase [Gemmatimonadota bacterium]